MVRNTSQFYELNTRNDKEHVLEGGILHNLRPLLIEIWVKYLGQTLDTSAVKQHISQLLDRGFELWKIKLPEDF